MHKKQLLLLCALSSAFAGINAVPGDKPRQHTKKEHESYGKVLTCKEVVELNKQLALFPMGTIRMRVASHRINDVLKAADQKKHSFANIAAEKTFVNEQLSMIIKPVQEFFDVIQDPYILKMIRPIISESLNNMQKSFIIDFCNSQQSIVTFCNNNIISCAHLESMGKELLHFFSSVDKSLSEKARAVADELEQKLKLAKKEKQRTDKK